jgi:UDP-N-acetylmuramyl pentapeptide synthase
MRTKNGAYIIDDSYNASPKSFNASLDYLSLFKGRKKIVITGGIIELGTLAKSVHKDLGKKLQSLVDRAIFTNKENANFTSLGMEGWKKLSFIGKPKELRQLFLSYMNKEYVVLLEGRQPSIIGDILHNI